MIPGSAIPLLLRNAAPAGYSISRSLRFNAPDSAYLSRTPASAGNRKTWTWAGWVKKSGLAAFQTLFANASGTSDTTYFVLSLGRSSDDPLYVSLWNVNLLVTTQVFRDPSAWYHIVFAFDATQGTNANKAKLYINGSEVTAFATDNRSSISNQDYAINAAAQHTIGGQASNYYLNGYLADVYFIDGQALTPSSFTETDATTGQLVKKAYTGSFTGNSFYLTFEDNSAATAAALGKDSSGLGNNWTPNNLSVTAGAGNDSLVDVPTNGAETDTGVGGEVRGNYCTWNPLQNIGGTQTLVDGNLSNTGASSSCIGTIAIPPSGKWYVEVAVGAYGAARGKAGICDATGGKTVEFAGASSSGTIGIAVNRDAGEVKLYFNNVLQSTTLLSTAGYGTSELIFIKGFTSTQGPTVLNAGQRPFAYTAPSGFKALCTANLPAPLVTKPSTVMDVKLYTGNGSTQTISGLGFSPDFVWIKARSSAQTHSLTDVVRGTSKQLFSNLTNAEGSETDQITAFNSDGFSLGANVAGTGGVNTSSVTYAAWTWDAGSSTVTNTAGSITSSVRANATAGFSIITGTGNGSFGHGLGVAPAMYIIKSRSSGGTGWWVNHKGLANQSDQYLGLHSTSAVQTVSWGGSPTSTIAYVSNAFVGSDNWVCYAFAPVVGYSSFGSYTSNGSSDGPFVYTGFRPRWIMIKCSSSNQSGNAHWAMYDTSRLPTNEASSILFANLSLYEFSTYSIDILSNGFKIRDVDGEINGGTNTYIYAAFAESPFNYARAR